MCNTIIIINFKKNNDINTYLTLNEIKATQCNTMKYNIANKTKQSKRK